MRGRRPPLLCGLGWHAPDPDARWNEGYYFTKCRRCDADMVRAAYGGWRLPRGYRVVWQAQPPGDLPVEPGKEISNGTTATAIETEKVETPLDVPEAAAHPLLPAVQAPQETVIEPKGRSGVLDFMDEGDPDDFFGPALSPRPAVADAAKEDSEPRPVHRSAAVQ